MTDATSHAKKDFMSYTRHSPIINRARLNPGWWFGNMTFYDFPYIGNSNPNRRTHIFQRGRSTTNQNPLVDHHFLIKMVVLVEYPLASPPGLVALDHQRAANLISQEIF